MSTATEVRIRAAEFDRRMAPMRARLNQHIGDVFAMWVERAFKRRRKAKGWRRHVRRMKATTRK